MPYRYLESDNLVMTVRLRNGRLLEGCDFPENFLGDTENFVSVFVENRLCSFPLDTVEYFEIYEPEPEPEPESKPERKPSNGPLVPRSN